LITIYHLNLAHPTHGLHTNLLHLTYATFNLQAETLQGALWMEQDASGAGGGGGGAEENREGCGARAVDKKSIE
jgi:hypothetical protein